MRTALTLLVGVVIGVVIWWLGASPLWAVALALPPTVFLLLVLRLPRATDVVWAAGPVPPSSISSAHASTLASRLGEAAENPARYQDRFRQRLRRLGIDEENMPSPQELAERLRRVE